MTLKFTAALFTAAPIAEITRADYDRLFSVNVSGTLFCMQAAARHMSARGEGGKIIDSFPECEAFKQGTVKSIGWTMDKKSKK